MGHSCLSPVVHKRRLSHRRRARCRARCWTCAETVDRFAFSTASDTKRTTNPEIQMGARKDEEPEKVVSPDGTTITVWQSGAGPPLVLVHGSAADHSRWAPVLPALGVRFTVLAIDRRARGQSGAAEDYAIEREFEDVAAVAEWAGGAVNVLGHSYGGVCALEAALLTDTIAKLVLYEPPMGFLASPPEGVHRLHALLEAGEHDELLAVFMREVAGLPPDQVELLRSLPAWEARLAVAHTIPREERASREYSFDPDRFRGLRTPTLFLQGGDSPDPSGRPPRRSRRRYRTVASPSCRASDMPRWTPAPNCSSARY